MQFNKNIQKLQQELGMTGKQADGLRGPQTNAAILAAADAGRLIGNLPPVPSKGKSRLNEASLEKLAGVHDDLIAIVLEASNRCQVGFSVIEGLRSRERQAQLVQAGASKTMNSKHLTGHAVDLWPQDANGKNLPSDAAFKDKAQAKAASAALWDGLRVIAATIKAVAAEKGIKLTWGGDWSSFPDGPHFQLD